MRREGLTQLESGDWVFVEGSDRWRAIPYLDENMCLHKVAMCPSCWEAWFDENNILLASRQDPRDTRNFDSMAAEARELLGIPETSTDASAEN